MESSYAHPRKIAAAVLLLILSGCFFQPEDDGYVQPKDPASVRVITEGIDPSVSPDGKLLAFSRNGAIFISDTGGKYERQLTGSGVTDIMPQWSPDGRMIGFIRKSNVISPYGRLIVIDTVSSVIRSVTMNDDVFCRFVVEQSSFRYTSSPVWSWSPNGSSVAFYSGHDTSTFLSIVRSDGSGMITGKYLLNQRTWGTWDDNRSGFCWLPGNDRLLCTSNADQDSSSLYMVTVGIGSMTPLNNTIRGANPGCSATGRYTGYFSHTYGSYLVNDIQTGQTLRVFTGGLSPKMSPDGRVIVSYHYTVNYNPDGYSDSQLIAHNVQFGNTSTVALSGWDYSFVFHPSSKWVFLSAGGMIKKAEIK
ncbi:MAG: PD40 domain-containing protein [Bacteroidetes bacterium]|nr:PD40 domain-containing protein [Bacteroidota bacterium]